MHTKPASLLSYVVAGALVCGARHATALSCAPDNVVAPRPDEVGVPTNTLVWCPVSGLERELELLTVRDSAGAEVPGTSTVLATRYGEILVFRPGAELSASTVYEVNCPQGLDEPRPYSFTTGTGPHTKAPPVPDVSNVEVGIFPDDGWGASYIASFPNVAELGSIFVLDLGGSSTLNPSEVSGNVGYASSMYYSRDFAVGRGPCLRTWLEAEPGASTTVALGAFDVTGAFSGWSETITVTLPSTFPEAPDVDEEEVESADRYVQSPDEAPGADDTDTSSGAPPEPTADAVEDSEVAVPNVEASERPATDTGCGCYLGRSAGSPLAAVGLVAALVSLLGRRRAQKRISVASAPRG